MRFTKSTKLAALLTGAVMLLGGCGNSAAPAAEVMKVGDVGISGGLYSFYFNNGYSQLSDAEAAREMATEQCENNFLIVAVAHAMGVELTDEQKSEQEEYKKQVVDSYDGKYNDFLKENNLTDTDVDQIISVTYYAEALQDKLEPKEYTDEEKRQYFKDNYRRAKHILISTKNSDTNEDKTEEEQEEAKKKAEELLEKAKNGENFDTLISENSEDPGSASNPDGYVFTDNEMVTEFQDGVDSIQPGEFTLVKSTYGYHVIQRLALDENPEFFETEYANVADRIETLMENKRFEEQVKAWAQEYGVETSVNEEEIDKIVEKAAK